MLEVPVSNFASLFGLNNWINVRIEKGELNRTDQKNSSAQQQKKPARPTRPNAMRAQLAAKPTGHSQSLSPPVQNFQRCPQYRAACPTPRHGLTTCPYPLPHHLDEAKSMFPSLRMPCHPLSLSPLLLLCSALPTEAPCRTAPLLSNATDKCCRAAHLLHP
jgi:hypothetical protein